MYVASRDTKQQEMMADGGMIRRRFQDICRQPRAPFLESCLVLFVLHSPIGAFLPRPFHLGSVVRNPGFDSTGHHVDSVDVGPAFDLAGPPYPMCGQVVAATVD